MVRGARTSVIALASGRSAALNLPDGEYKELLNSTWGPYQVEWEDEHPNGGWDARVAPGIQLERARTTAP